MGADPDLDELAAAGRHRRQAEARAAAEAERAQRAEEDAELEARRRRADRLLSYSTLRSLSAMLPVFITFASLAGLALLFAASLGLALAGTGFPIWMAIIVLATVTPALLAGLWIAWLRRRDISFRAARPYAVRGYQRSLDYGRSYPSTKFDLVFAADPPARATLEDVFANLDAKTEVVEIEGSVVTCEVSGDGSKFDGHRRWLVRWFYPACAEVFDLIHRSHPIAELRFPSY